MTYVSASHIILKQTQPSKELVTREGIKPINAGQEVAPSTD